MENQNENKLVEFEEFFREIHQNVVMDPSQISGLFIINGKELPKEKLPCAMTPIVGEATGTYLVEKNKTQSIVIVDGKVEGEYPTEYIKSARKVIDEWLGTEVCIYFSKNKPLLILSANFDKIQDGERTIAIAIAPRLAGD